LTFNRGFNAEVLLQRFIEKLGYAKNAFSDVWRAVRHLGYGDKPQELKALASFEKWQQQKNQQHNKKTLPLALDNAQPKLNWFDDTYKADWETLRNLKNSHVEWMLRYVDLIKKQPHKKYEPSIHKAMAELGGKLFQDKQAYSAVKLHAAKLSELLHVSTKILTQHKSKNRGANISFD
jgi:hypothetical protein